VKPPVCAIDVHAAHHDDSRCDAAHRVGDVTRLRLGHRAHVHGDVWREIRDLPTMFRDPVAVAMDVTHVGRQIDLVHAAVEDRHGMTGLR
jgi:hypothetical protein